ncbi:MAG: hypothetical protein WCB57_08730 [Pseudonocardiaceae bacterium]
MRQPVLVGSVLTWPHDVFYLVGVMGFEPTAAPSQNLGKPCAGAREI